MIGLVRREIHLLPPISRNEIAHYGGSKISRLPDAKKRVRKILGPAHHFCELRVDLQGQTAIFGSEKGNSPHPSDAGVEQRAAEGSTKRDRATTFAEEATSRAQDKGCFKQKYREIQVRV